MDSVMLVLRRRVGEVIAIGDHIQIEVMEISRTRVKLGVTAPRAVPVIRQETLSVATENRRALELVSSRGAGGMSETLRLLGEILSGAP
jgi:carbon storage regulator